MISELQTIIHNSVLDSPVPAKDLAKHLGKPYSTLLREVNPYDSGAKLSAETLMHLMSYTGNTKPLEFIASKLGYSLMPATMGVTELHATPFDSVQSHNSKVLSDSPSAITCPACGFTSAVISFRNKESHTPSFAPEATDFTKRL